MVSETLVLTEVDRAPTEAAPAPPGAADSQAGPTAVRPHSAGTRRSWQRGHVDRLVLADATAAAAGCLASAFISGRFGPGHHLEFTPGYVVAWVLALGVGRAYETRHLGVGSVEFVRVLRSGITIFAVVALAEIMLGLQMGRPAVLAIALTVLLDLAARLVLRRRLYRARWRGRSTDRVIVVGRRNSVAQVVADLRLGATHGLEVAGACLIDLDRAAPGPTAEEVEASLGVALLGGLLDVPAAVAATGSHVVVVAGGTDLAAGSLRRLAWSLEPLGTELLVSPGVGEVAGPRLTVRPYPTLPLLHVEQPRLSGAARLVKGLGDRSAAGLSILALSPVFLAVWVLVRATSPGPGLYSQIRIGLNGKPFTVWKFRSMIAGADRQISELDMHNDKDDVLFKIRRDPRVTTVGAALRRLSIDELPQLFNVFGGSMSLVGPRPPLPREVEQYGSEALRRLVVKPGMTGLWQVSGRSDLTWEESVRLDLRYVENWSVGLDMSILCQTIHAVLGGRGAY